MKCFKILLRKKREIACKERNLTHDELVRLDLLNEILDEIQGRNTASRPTALAAVQDEGQALPRAAAYARSLDG